MAELMAAAGAWSAIELDGGGSSTTVTIPLLNYPFVEKCCRMLQLSCLSLGNCD
jgi:hypothetical protein